MEDHKAHTEAPLGSERSFGVVFAAALGALGLYPLTKGSCPAYFALVLALLLLLISLARPEWLRWPNRLWAGFGRMLGAIVAPVVLAVVFVTVFIPMGLSRKLLGKDSLQRKFDQQRETYWITREEKMQSMERQF
jgi:hypothetical protein